MVGLRLEVRKGAALSLLLLPALLNLGFLRHWARPCHSTGHLTHCWGSKSILTLTPYRIPPAQPCVLSSKPVLAVPVSVWLSHWYLGLRSKSGVLMGPYALMFSPSPLLPPHTVSCSLGSFEWPFKDSLWCSGHFLAFIFHIQPTSRSSSFSF